MCALPYRVEPKGTSHVFIVHGSECRKTAHSGCTFDPSRSSQRKGMMYVIDVREAMGTDWKVSWLVQLSCCCCGHSQISS